MATSQKKASQRYLLSLSPTPSFSPNRVPQSASRSRRSALIGIPCVTVEGRGTSTFSTSRVVKTDTATGRRSSTATGFGGAMSLFRSWVGRVRRSTCRLSLVLTAETAEAWMPTSISLGWGGVLWVLEAWDCGRLLNVVVERLRVIPCVLRSLGTL